MQMSWTDTAKTGWIYEQINAQRVALSFSGLALLRPVANAAVPIPAFVRGPILRIDVLFFRLRDFGGLFIPPGHQSPGHIAGRSLFRTTNVAGKNAPFGFCAVWCLFRFFDALFLRQQLA